MNVFIIAEIAQAHAGSFDKALAYIEALAGTGVDAVKFQTHIAQAESSIYEPFRVKFSEVYASRFDYWKAMEFTFEQWQELKAACEQQGMEFISSPFSNAAVGVLEHLGVNRYKVGSGEVNNFLLLEKLSQTGKPLILSSGMSSYAELDASVAFLQKRHVPFSILQCTTSYPTAPESYGLNVIQELKLRYQVPVGYSDHSSSLETCIAAAALGAEILEFHVVFDKNDPTPDAKSSLTIAETRQLVESVRRLERARQHPIDKHDNSSYSELKQIFEKSLAVNKALPQGHVLTFDDLEAKKPKGYGIDASLFERVLGKMLSKPLEAWSFLNWEDLQGESSSEW